MERLTLLRLLPWTISKKLVEPFASRNISVDRLSRWETRSHPIQEIFSPIALPTQNASQRQALFLLAESMERLHRRRTELTWTRFLIPRHHSPKTGIVWAHQLELHTRTTAFYNSLYSTMSAWMRLSDANQHAFPRVRTRTVPQFLATQGVASRLALLFPSLSRSLEFRSLLTHAGIAQAVRWTTITLDGGPVQLRLFGEASRTGSVPPGSERAEFADGPGWDFIAPFESNIYLVLQMLVMDSVDRIAGATSRFEVTSVEPEADGTAAAFTSLGRSWTESRLDINATLLNEPDRWLTTCLGRDIGAQSHQRHNDIR